MSRALVGPGRLEEHVFLPLPHQAARLRFLLLQLPPRPLSGPGPGPGPGPGAAQDGEQAAKGREDGAVQLAAATEGWSFAALRELLASSTLSLLGMDGLRDRLDSLADTDGHEGHGQSARIDQPPSVQEVLARAFSRLC
jgi:hypothetical protein